MRIIRGPKKLTEELRKLKRQKASIGFVPTMGALHEGHLSLIRRARKENDFVVVSIFVNPAQFAPNEDFKKYPRPIRKDISLLQKEKVDFLFYPSPETMYPKGTVTFVNVEQLESLLCGKSRPGHFRGVATVVAKLFNIISPDIAYFGQKDAQQAIIIKRMAGDLNFPVQIRVMSTVREKDGLAISSRNTYLNHQERKDAVVLSQALSLAKGLIRQGINDAGKIIRRMKELIQQKKSARIDYIAIVDTKTLQPLERIKGKALIALAVWFGRTRLIDNFILKEKRGQATFFMGARLL